MVHLAKLQRLFDVDGGYNGCTCALDGWQRSLGCNSFRTALALELTNSESTMDFNTILHHDILRSNLWSHIIPLSSMLFDGQLTSRWYYGEGNATLLRLESS